MSFRGRGGGGRGGGSFRGRGGRGAGFLFFLSVLL